MALGAQVTGADQRWRHVLGAHGPQVTLCTLSLECGTVRSVGVPVAGHWPRPLPFTHPPTDTGEKRVVLRHISIDDA